ncbi:MAG: PASTA domain-containing protein, partial [Bacteroidetes bacterium]|nr:PASTA domain-containing protein [Bacteroidota bacterium]
MDVQLPPSAAPPKKNRWAFLAQPWAVVIMTLFVTAIIIGLSINSIMLSVLNTRPEVVVPDLQGKSISEALQIVSDIDLALKQEGIEFDDGLPAGTVLQQQPPSGMNVRTGRAIRIVLSKGGEAIFIPMIIGKLLAEAQSSLAADGLQLGAVEEIYSMEHPAG